MVEAVRAAGAIITRRISSAAATGSTADVIEAVGDIWRLNLTRSDFAIGCPVIAGGLARASEPEVAEVSAEGHAGMAEVDRIATRNCGLSCSAGKIDGKPDDHVGRRCSGGVPDDSKYRAARTGHRLTAGALSF